MTREEAILYLEHTSSDDFNLEEHQIQNRLNAIQFLLKENQDLKKQLEEYIKQNMKLKDELFDKRKEYQDTYKDVRIEIKEYKTQQKGFIKYLEDEKDRLAREHSNICKDKFDEVDDILQKYKSIIGVSDENNIK